MWSDLHGAFRGLLAGRATTVTAFVILSLGVSAAIVTFSVVDTIALRPLPLPEPHRLIAIARADNRSPQLGPLAPQDLFSWQAGVPALQGLAGIGPWSVRVQTDTGVQALTAFRVTPNLFDVLQVSPAIGRTFSPEHERAGSDAVIVLSHGFWMRHFAGNPAVVGTRVAFAKETREILGVMPAGFTYPIGPAKDADVWVPYVPRPNERDHASPGRGYFLQLVGRLQPEATLALAREQIEAVTRGIAAQYPNQSFWRNARPVVMPLHERVVGPAAQWLQLMLAAVALVLLVACVNVANLLLARATTRGRELATRAALGAGHLRIARMLLFEGLLLAAAAAAVALAISSWGLSAITAMLPAGLARASSIALDGRVVGVSIAAAVLTGVFFGGVPAWHAMRADLVAAIRDGSGAVSGGRRRARVMRALLTAEVAFVVAVLVAVGLFVGSFVQIVRTDLGFDRRQVVGFSVNRDVSSLPAEQRMAAFESFVAELVDQVRTTPGVAAAAFADGGLPLSGGSTRYSIKIDGIETADMLELRAVSAEYFEALGMRMVEGRALTRDDRVGTPAVAVINQAAARRYFPGGSAVGRSFEFRAPTTVVGVVADPRHAGPEVDVQPQMYLPLTQNDMLRSSLSGELIVRADGSPQAVATAVQSVLQRSLGLTVAPTPRFVDESFRTLTASRRFNASVMAMFGIIALVIGAIGVYGVMAFSVAQQVRAIGIRMALGASRARILRDVVADAAMPLGLGVGVGLVAAWTMSGVFASVIFGVRPAEASIYAMVAATAAATGLLAALLPGSRAARIDPSRALRM
jgi:predicted permease